MYIKNVVKVNELYKTRCLNYAIIMVIMTIKDSENFMGSTGCAKINCALLAVHGQSSIPLVLNICDLICNKKPEVDHQIFCAALFSFQSYKRAS